MTTVADVSPPPVVNELVATSRALIDSYFLGRKSDCSVLVMSAIVGAKASKPTVRTSHPAMIHQGRLTANRPSFANTLTPPVAVPVRCRRVGARLRASKRLQPTCDP